MFAELLNEGGLSLDRLASFCLVAEVGGVTKAAKGDPGRQSLFSRQIKELEEFFGTELIRRKGRGIELTDSGRRLQAASREFAAALADFKSDCQGKPVEVVVGTGETVIQWVIIPHLDELQSRLPNVRIKLLNLATATAISRLTEGAIDFAIIRRDVVRRPLKSIPLGAMRFSLFIPKRLAEGAAGNAADRLNSVPLATLEGAGTFRTELNEQARKSGVKLRIQVECPSFPLVARAVAKGSVAAILPSIAGGDLRDFGVEEFPVPFLEAKRREMVLAMNPRVMRIRPFLPRVGDVLQELCRF